MNEASAPLAESGAELTLRRAEAKDAALLLSLIKALATYERAPDAVKTTEADLLRDGFASNPNPSSSLPTGPRFFAELAQRDGRAVGFALWFISYSTWVGRPGMYLEDLFVLPEERGRGVGRALFAELARIALQEGYGRIDWKVLDWNKPAEEFYAGLGAKATRDWFSMRVEGEAALRKIAAG